jgi:hypothetical protein
MAWYLVKHRDNFTFTFTVMELQEIGNGGYRGDSTLYDNFHWKVIKQRHGGGGGGNAMSFTFTAR